ncbi:hypothetical protein ACQUFW_10300 [Acinetobacter johnsonii]|jgi:Holliday junction resolvase-like predicted endonuclease|uniref:NERD domain-containing protein n=2 Tax=Acinetobacter johnsonii TaxID=40214 RepID=A0A427V0W8_ACIJO|nr:MULTISPECIES: hypothetical protein [Acinetobacter]QKY90986.1 hypothetical protein HUK62_11105 [Acinetobacter sp. NEB 394]RSE26389.1 hypothetical protein EGT73_02095 [Acinetobacter johnsonii]
MKNYYEEKFDSLFTEFDPKKALEKIVEDLLYKSSQPKYFDYKNKFDMFWQSNFIKLLTVDEVRSENYILALSQYIRYTITDKNICINYLKLDIQSFILAVRYSGIILNSEHDSWGILKEISQEFDSEELCGFIQTVTHLQLQYKHRLAVYEDIQNKLNIGQITAMSFSSLYAYEYLVPNKDFFQLPYQFDPEEKNSAEVVWRAFDEIIKTSRKNTKKLTEKSLALALKFKMIPFLLGEGMTSELQLQYDLFKKLVAIKVELINYKRNVLESFSFDSTVKYILKNESLSYLNQRNVKDNWLEKHSLLLNYWLIVGSQRLFDSDYIYRILPTGDNLEANAIALSKAFGVKEQLKQIYGIEYLKVDNVHLDLFDVMMTLSLSQAHYLKDHIHKFEQFLSDSNFNLEALSKLMMHGFIIGENRMPMTFALENDKSKKMSSWITEGSNNQKLKQMKKILKFWSFDLYDENDQSTYMQKPFYRIDDFIFQFPWLTAFQNLNTAMINYVRKLHKNRLELKSETDQIELNLAEKLDRIGFQVFCQYVPSEGNAGEIDLIAMYDNHVIVAEVKSTYIRSSIQEIYEYKKFVLNKASYQLDNKVEYIKRHFLSRHFEDINDVIIHSWIIDTTLEFDHEYFGNHLKVSLDEVIITSNCESEFMQKLVDEQFDIEKDEVKIDPIQFLESIEKNTFWSKQLGNYDHYMEKMLSKLAS